MKQLLTLTLFGLLAVSIKAQTCLELAIQKGQTAYNDGNYPKARQYWEAGKDCPSTNAQKLNALIWKAKDGDGDGVVNGRDDCPDTYGSQANGCPPPKKELPAQPLATNPQREVTPPSGGGAGGGVDTDEDGTPDPQDDCPTDYGPHQYRGCPDRDFDETPDIKDPCPDQKGPKNTAGCPDRDNDAIPDKDDKCPDTPGLKAFDGCPDRDNDGVIDSADDCPDTPGLKRFAGCPDKDFDETPDPKDGCPDTPGPKTAYGCPDRDGDGVADKDDQCPDVLGTAAEKGCPEPAPTWMVRVPGGTFTMGDLFGEGEGNETQHSVTVSDFYLGKTEVTFDDFDAFCTATGRTKPSDESWGRGKRPVINVSWLDAVEYCNWLSQQQKRTPAYTISGSNVTLNSLPVGEDRGGVGYRLPTEAEWEYAAREGGKKVRFGNGKDQAKSSEINFSAQDSSATYADKGERRAETVEVGSLQNPNALGLHDMSGNVWEWCNDWYAADPSSAQTDPANPTGRTGRVLRGGSWNYCPQGCRAAYRYYHWPTVRVVYIGFRVALAASFQ